MLTLFLDFASHSKSIALIDSGETIAIEKIIDHTDEAKLLPMIEEMLQNKPITHNLSPIPYHLFPITYPLSPITSSEPTNPFHKLQRIVATTGPGGFMSLRVALSLGNTLAWSLNLPIAGIHLSDLWAARLPKNTNALWLHSTKKDALFVRGFGSLSKDIPEATLVTLSDLLLDIKDSADFVGELIEEHAKILPVSMVDSCTTLSDVLPTIVEHLTYQKPPLLPWYGRGITR